MNHTQLQIGDRVALQETFLGLPAGTGGTIVHIYRQAKALYAVQFDATRLPLPTHADQLIALLQSRERGGADARLGSKHPVVA